MTLPSECIDNEPSPVNQCSPSSCGPNAECTQTTNGPLCNCKPGYSGSPPNCRPECMTNADCSGDKACSQYKCVNPCIGSCAATATCYTVNHSPVCKCAQGYTGDPFSSCFRQCKLFFLSQGVAYI